MMIFPPFQNVFSRRFEKHKITIAQYIPRERQEYPFPKSSDYLRRNLDL